MPTVDYEVYVDEAGDRGWGGKSSPVFTLTAVVVKRTDDHVLRATLESLNGAMGRDPRNVLHWAENVRDHSDRKQVALELSRLPIDIITVTVCKASLIGNNTALSGSVAQYNYSMRRLLERVSWLLRARHGTGQMRLAHVRRFKYESLHQYLDKLGRDRSCNINWASLRDGHRPRIEQPAQRHGLQVADLAAGCVYSAVRQDRHGGQEPMYLEQISGRFWAGPTGKLTTYGLHFIAGGSHDCGSHYPWLARLVNGGS